MARASGGRGDAEVWQGDVRVIRIAGIVRVPCGDRQLISGKRAVSLQPGNGDLNRCYQSAGIVDVIDANVIARGESDHFRRKPAGEVIFRARCTTENGGGAMFEAAFTNDGKSRSVDRTIVACNSKLKEKTKFVCAGAVEVQQASGSMRCGFKEPHKIDSRGLYAERSTAVGWRGVEGD